MITAAVIDANAISRNLLASVLEDGGFHVVGGASANPAGLAGIIKLQPQIVCIDIGLPDEPGLERLDMLRGGVPKALIFMVSGTIDSGALQSGLERGVHGFIVKPFNAQTVLKVIRGAVLKLAQQHPSGTPS